MEQWTAGLTKYVFDFQKQPKQKVENTNQGFSILTDEQIIDPLSFSRHYTSVTLTETVIAWPNTEMLKHTIAI